jgi:hypothetical protein
MCLKCIQCGKIRKKANSKFCSFECYTKSEHIKRKKVIIKKCLFCKKDFSPLSGRENIQRYCSRNCAYKDRTRIKNERGYYFKNPRKHTVEEKAIIREKMLKLWKTKEYRTKHSLAMKNTVCRGEKHMWWKNGASKKNGEAWLSRCSAEFRNWREKVFERDNWICQKYHTKGGKLNPHHIKNFAQYPELRFVLTNGITLSQKAHREFHKKYGKKNNNEIQLLEFLTN